MIQKNSPPQLPLLSLSLTAFLFWKILPPRQKQYQSFKPPKKKLKSIIETFTPEISSDKVANDAESNELIRAKKALESQMANVREQERRLQEKVALAEKLADARVAALQKQLVEAEAGKLKARNIDMQAQLDH